MLDPSSGATENLEALAPLIKSIQDTDSEQLYLRGLDKFVEEKEREIEKICQGNYEVSHLPYRRAIESLDRSCNVMDVDDGCTTLVEI